ncbi:MAG: Lrp/AsnC family transcriptional regulator [Desulfovibrionales bacterium]
MKKNLDPQDWHIVSQLAEDGRLSAGKLSETLNVTGPTVRSRIKALLSSGILRIAGLVDPGRTPELTIALVGITLQSHRELDAKLEQISSLGKVHWAAVVTGRYDLMVEVILSGGIADLYQFMHEDLSQVGGISSSETFVVMKARNKWIRLPRGTGEKLL